MINNTVEELIKQELAEVDLGEFQLLSQGKYLLEFKIDALEFEFNCPQLNESNKYQLDVNSALIVSSYDALHVDIEDSEVLVWDNNQEPVDGSIDWGLLKDFQQRVRDNKELF